MASIRSIVFGPNCIYRWNTAVAYRFKYSRYEVEKMFKEYVKPMFDGFPVTPDNRFEITKKIRECISNSNFSEPDLVNFLLALRCTKLRNGVEPQLISYGSMESIMYDNTIFRINTHCRDIHQCCYIIIDAWKYFAMNWLKGEWKDKPNPPYEYVKDRDKLAYDMRYRKKKSKGIPGQLELKDFGL